ncbi:retrovirus-related pol polyprotein from transposon TNT 1-94, partial [Tanacetum coccineum]
SPQSYHPEKYTLAIMEAIRLFLAYAAHKNITVHQMDIKTTFLNMILQEVYVSQPQEVIDPDHPHPIYKMDKALYRLKQVHRAWYEMFSSYLISQKFIKGVIDPSLFTSKQDANYEACQDT